MKIRGGDACFAFLILRLGIGITFFLAGLNKLMNYSGVIDSFPGNFAGTWLPGFLVTWFAHTLPFAEIILGFLLIVGLFTRPALYLAGLLMVVLNFGLLVRGDSDKAAGNIPYLIVIALDIMLINYNKYSLDQLLFGMISDFDD